MTAPSLSLLSTAPQAATAGLTLKAGQLAFLVVTEGTWGGRQWSAGDVVVCSGAAQAGRSTVLVPNGRGFPRFGRKLRDGLQGSAGEPCSIRRFHPAGEIVEGLRSWKGQWISLFETQTELPVQHTAASPKRQSAKHTPVNHRQLVLF